jgi:hypothetical protein
MDPEHDALLEKAISAARQSRRAARPTSPGHVIEHDHLAGQATMGSLTVRLRRRDHRTLSELRRVLGFDSLPPAEGDPILLLAHLLAGLSTLLALLVEYLVEWARALRERYGPRYWAGLPSPVVP